MEAGRGKLTTQSHLLTNDYRLLSILTAFLFLPLCANATVYEWTSGIYQITEYDNYGVDWINLRNNAKIDMVGGNLGVMYAYDASEFDLQGGTVGKIVQFYGNSTVNIYGGIISGGFTMYDNSVINVTGGVFQNHAGISLAGVNSVLNISGGDTSLMGFIYPDQGTINIYGYDLNLEPVIPSPTCNHTTKVTGFWADHTPFTFMLARTEYTSPNIVLHEIPEPCMLGLISLGIVILRKHLEIS